MSCGLDSPYLLPHPLPHVQPCAERKQGWAGDAFELLNKVDSEALTCWWPRGYVTAALGRVGKEKVYNLRAAQEKSFPQLEIHPKLTLWKHDASSSFIPYVNRRNVVWTSL